MDTPPQVKGNGGYRPQHLRTIVEERKPGELPEEWKKDPSKVLLVSEHQQWLGQSMTQKVHNLLLNEIAACARVIGGASINRDVDSESLRRIAAQMQALIEIEKVIYDTEKFVGKLIV